LQLDKSIESGLDIGALRGCLDYVDHRRIAGWAADDDGPTNLEVLADGIVVGEILARSYRADVRRAIGDDGRHGFDFSLYPPLSGASPHLIEVRRVADGAPLPGPPPGCVTTLLLPAPVFDADFRDRLSGAIEMWARNAESKAEIEYGLRHVNMAIERLLQASADLADEIRHHPRPAPQECVAMAPAGPLVGHLDEVHFDLVRGWALDTSAPDLPVRLEIIIDGTPLGTFLAGEPRPDVVADGFGGGYSGFCVRLIGLSPISPHVVAVRRAADRAALISSPVTLEANLEELFWPSFLEAFERIAGAAEQRADLDPPLAFLRAAAERLTEARPDLFPPATEPAGLSALVIDDFWPIPERDAGSNAVLDHMRSLIRLGFRVSVAAAVEMGGARQEALSEIGARWFCAPEHYSVEEVLRRHGAGFDLVYLYRVSNAGKYGALARHYCPRARQLYSVADLHWLRRERQAAVEGRIELVGESQRLKLAELAAAAFTDAVITHSSAEAEILCREVRGLEVHVVPWSAEPRPRKVPFAERRGIAFIGGYMHEPNIDAALWLMREIMPLVWREDPAIPCLLVGPDIPDGITRHVRPGVVLYGPADALDEIFEAVRLTVAPLRYGAGVKGKVVDSLAAGVPCAMTTIAGEGLDLPGEIKDRISDTAQGLAAEIVRLHRDESANARAAAAGLDFVAAALSRERIDALMRRAVGTAILAKATGG
jgi:O-antigen biosynthesis protein